MRTWILLASLVPALTGCSSALDFASVHSPQPSQTVDVVERQTGAPSLAKAWPVTPQHDVEGPRLPQGAEPRPSSGGSGVGSAMAVVGILNNPGSIGAFTAIAVVLVVAAAVAAK